MEHVLTLKKEEMRDYESSMKTVLQRLKENQQTYETLISSQEERDLYEKYTLDWQKYFKESQKSIALSKNNINEQSVAILRENTRPSYRELIKPLDLLIESNLKYANSLSRYSKELFREFRLTMNILFIIGITAFFVLVFNLFERMKKRIK